jgi:hypothetical protein
MNRSNLLAVIGGIGFIIIIVLFTNEAHKEEAIRKASQPKDVQYLRDSLEMEWYKKQLESYPFEHSKIPDSVK